jgi:hypothetical protein
VVVVQDVNRTELTHVRSNGRLLLVLLNCTFYGVSQVSQYLIPEVIVIQICHVYVVLICSCPTIVGIYNKLNKTEKKEVNVHLLRPCVFSGFCRGVNEVFTFLECSAALIDCYRHFETGC